MGLCKSKQTNKYKQETNGSEMENIKAKIKYLKLSQPHQIHEAVLTAYINKKSQPDKGGVVFMRRKEKSHITMRLLPGAAPSDDPDGIEQEILLVCRQIEDHFIEIGALYELYINKCEGDVNCYKLYCHIDDKN